jgi:hypothetical protein
MIIERPATALRVYVGGLDVFGAEPDLCAAFERVGVRLASVELVVNRATGCRRGFAFVIVAGLPAGTDPDAVVARMGMALVGDRPVTVKRLPNEPTSVPTRGPSSGAPPAAVLAGSGVAMHQGGGTYFRI